MKYTKIENMGVNEDAPLTYMIHIDNGSSRNLFVGSSPRGGDLPRQGQLWTAGSLLQRDPPFPDWFFRCERVHFAMAEAWLQNTAINLVMLGNARISQLEETRQQLASTMQADLNAEMPRETGAFVIRLRMLKFKALDKFKRASDPRALKSDAPHLWEAACEGYADMHAVPVPFAHQTLRRKLSI